jgi:short-subunit dehydrogenase
MNRLLQKIDVGKSGPWIALAGLSAITALAARDLLGRRWQRPFEVRGKTVLLTGGSRGLGLALAQALGGRGARLALCARDEDELREACDQLRHQGIEAAAFPGDVTDALAIPGLVNAVIQRMGAIDVLVNDAGSISVGPFDSFSKADFEQSMNLMFWAPVNLTLAVLPHMKQRGAGHIVNIASVGGRVAIPHLLPYSCAKFALTGFSTGLSGEANLGGVHVLTVVPGLMRTGSYLNANFQGDAKNEFAWFALLGNVPGFSVAADYAANRICEALEREHRVCTISLPAKILIASEALAPDATRAILKSVAEYLLPHSGARARFKGADLNGMLNLVFQGLTTLGRRAAQELNQ